MRDNAMFDVRSIVIGIILMLKRYTCINITIYEESCDEDFKNGIMALPLIGLAIGFSAFLIASMEFVYDGFFVSVLVLGFYCIVTKSVNLTDTYRTLNYIIKPKNQSEQIVGIIGTTIILLLYFSLFRIVPVTSLIIMPVAGYSSLIILSPIIKRNKEITTIMKYCGKYQNIAAFAISFLIASVFNYKLVISLSLTYMISGFIVSYLDNKIKVIPNSVEGLIVETAQIIFLTITYLIRI
jgi:cobalamin synthase